MSERPRLLFCHCAQAGVIPPEIREAVLLKLSECGIPYESVADLCLLAARRDPLLAQLASGPAPLTVAACHPRAVRALFAAAGAPLPPETTQFLNLRTGNLETLCAEIAALPSQEIDGSGPTSSPAAPSPAAPEGWNAWFPVIDSNRCTQCMQCLGFCLFGVYGVDAQSGIDVIAPENCKANCPACSRVCPETAIIFPKHGTGPINGDEIDDSGANRAAMKPDISALLGGDLYATLRERTGALRPPGARFSPERDPATALQERRRHLAALSEAAEIPPEVLMSLPPPEELARRVAEAKAKAESALGNRTAIE